MNKHQFFRWAKRAALVVCTLLPMAKSLVYGQLRIANYEGTLINAGNSSAFLDASSYTEYNMSANIGKGLLFPQLDLTQFTSFNYVGMAGIGDNYPTYFDGMLVYNTAVSGVAGAGNTEGTLSPGFWYYDNKSGTINGGTWKPVGGGMATWNVQNTTATATSDTQNIYQSGKVGIGASYATGTATSKLEVDGAATNKTSVAGTLSSDGNTIIVDFTKSNLGYYTSSSGNAISATGMKDGGAYTLAYTANVTTLPTVSAPGFTTDIPNTAPTTKAATQKAVYTIVCINTDAYVFITLF